MTTEIQQKDILLLYGLAEKPYSDMSSEERAAAAYAAYEHAKEAAFIRGLPIVYGENGLIIAEYADGTRFIRENGHNIQTYHAIKS